MYFGCSLGKGAPRADATQKSPRSEWRARKERLEASDPELAAAIEDVDRPLIDSCLRTNPWERVERCFDAADAIAELRTWRQMDARTRNDPA